MKSIVKIWYNFVQYNDGKEAGESYELHAIGVNGVIKITENIPGGVYGLAYYSIHFENGYEERIYNPNRVFFETIN